MADDRQTQQSQDAQRVADTTAKAAKKIAARRAAKKAAGKTAEKAAGGAIKKAFGGVISGFVRGALISVLVPFIIIIIFISLFVAFPASVAGSIADMTTVATENFRGWLDEVQASFSATAASVFIDIDGFFDDIYAFFTGDTTADALESQINDLIRYGGRTEDGEKTDYGESVNGETAVIYKYFLNKYVDIKRQAEDGLPPVVETAGTDYLEENEVEIPPEPTLPDSETITEGDETYTRTYSIDDSGNITIAGQYIGDDMGDFFKPVFYLLAANTLTQYDREAGDYAMNSLVILANEVADSVFEIVPSEPSGLTWEVELRPVDGGTQQAVYHLVLNVPYRIGTTTESINNIITASGNDPVDDATPIKANVENMCAFYGATLLPDLDEDGWGLVSFSAPIVSGVGGSISTMTPEEIAAAFGNIDISGCPEFALNVVNICQHIDQYATTVPSGPALGKVRIQAEFCQRAVADIFMNAAGDVNKRPTFGTALDTIRAWPACKTTASPPYSGFAVAGGSPYNESAGHIGIYLKTTDGQEYVLDSVLGQVNIQTFDAWKQTYTYAGYTGFGFFGTEYSSFDPS